eukprot:gene19988-9471_t
MSVRDEELPFQREIATIKRQLQRTMAMDGAKIKFNATASDESVVPRCIIADPRFDASVSDTNADGAADAACALCHGEVCADGVCERVECFVNPDGTDYRGTVATTADGTECLSWGEETKSDGGSGSSVSSLGGADTAAEVGIGPHNYCRNWDGNLGDRPWCYTVDPDVRWAYCNVGTAVEIADGCDFSGRTFANAEAFDDGNSNNGECIFPFEHDGVVHNSCAPATPDNPHCKWIQLDGFFDALWWNVRFVENTTLTVNGRSTWFAPYSKPYFLYWCQ